MRRNLKNSLDNSALIARLRRRLAPTLKASAAVPTETANVSSSKTAAVLIPLFEREDHVQVLYTRRSDLMPSHQGQVAFPGGRIDPADHDLIATALREAHEEVGIEPHKVEVIGRLPPAAAAASGYSVFPFVAKIDDAVSLRPDPREVAEIFSVPVDVLRDPGFRGSYKFKRGKHVAEFPAILYGGQVIWGLTLRITENLLELIYGGD